MTREPRAAERDHAALHEVDRVHLDGAATQRRYSDDPEETYQRIEALANHGTGSARDLPTMVASLSDALKMQVRDLMPALAKRVGGDAVLQIGELVHDRLDFTLGNALAASPPASEAQLRRRLRSADPAAVAWLGDNAPILAKVRKLLPGPFGLELPALAELPPALHGKPLLVEWFLTTTPKTIVALSLAQRGTGALAASLDELRQWSWLDDLHVGRGFAFGLGLENLRATTDVAAKAKIQQLLGSFNSETITAEASEIGKRDLRARVATRGDTGELLDAGARAMGVPAADRDRTVARLRGEPANVVLEFAAATSLELAASIPLLAAATGATAQHMLALVLRFNVDDRVAALKDDALRALVRKAVGSKTPLTHFLPVVEDREAAHAALFGDEALREWAYQDNEPLTRLWIAAGSASARDACKLVRREVGFDWVARLPATAPDVELRRFALNCNDPKRSQFVHDHLLGDRTFQVDAADNRVEAAPSEAYGRGDRARLDVAVLGQDVDPRAVLDRLADLTADERAALLKDGAALRRVFAGLADQATVRAVFLLGPTIAQLVALPIAPEARLLDYLRTRPPEEEHAALATKATIAKARALFAHTGPFLVFPSLADPAVLAKALAVAPDLLAWLLDGTDPSFALACLAREPVRTAAAPLFEARAHVYDKLPGYQHLLPAGKRGFDSLVKASEDDDTRREAEQYRAGDATLDPVAARNGERMAAASSAHHLWDAIDALAGARGNEASALALVNDASARDRIALLDGSHPASVANLKGLVLMSPHHVFPTLSTAQLLAMPDAAAWLLEAELPYVTLTRLAHQPRALAALAKVLEAKPGLAHKWIGGLAAGAGATAIERVALDELSAHVTSEDVLRLLFHARYGTQVDATFPLAEAKRLWGVLARLPPAQVNQQVIEQFTHGEIGASAAGLWDHKNVVLNDDRKKLAGDDQSYEDAPLLGAAEIKRYYGLDDAALAKASAEGGWIAREQGQYRVKPVDTAAFTATVLHEVGHSVDQLLGEHTELIYGLGGWKRYGVDQFEDWAAEMGALRGIAGKDRADVIAAWKEALRAGQPVSEMVDAAHPARAATYAADPLIAAARAGGRFHYKEAPRLPHNGRVFTTNGGVLSSVPVQTADVAPSQYAMSAPAEYFAECYVEYYREYAGTPDTAGKKGGHLAGWIKQWFDRFVDTIQLSPQRLHASAPADGGAPRKSG